MSRPPSRAFIIRSIILKDLREFSRDRFWMILMPLSLGIIIAVFWILPDKMDETITVGLYPPALANAAGAARALALPGLQSGPGGAGRKLPGCQSGSGGAGRKLPGGREETLAKGLKIVAFESEDRLRAAVSGELEDDEEAGRVRIGIAFPDDFVSAVWTGKKTTVSVYVDVAVPEEMRDAVSCAVREVAYGLRALASGKHPVQALPVSLPDLETITLGEDRAGDQVAPREKLRPIVAVMILMIEALALAGLIAVEIQERTVTAMLVTPARIGDVLAAKGVTGVILGASQALIFLLATRSFGANWPLVTVLVLLGAVMASAVGMISGAAGRDFMNTLFYATIIIMPLMIPVLPVLFPGSVSPWVKMLPSYGLIDGMVGAAAYGRGFRDLAPQIGMALAWDAVLLGVGLLVLKKKVETL